MMAKRGFLADRPTPAFGHPDSVRLRPLPDFHRNNREVERRSRNPRNPAGNPDYMTLRYLVPVSAVDRAA